MVVDELWNKFLLSGKIEDYLKYSACNQIADGGNNGTDKDKRSDT
jgi:hypothetical protein